MSLVEMVFHHPTPSPTTILYEPDNQTPPHNVQQSKNMTSNFSQVTHDDFYESYSNDSDVPLLPPDMQFNESHVLLICGYSTVLIISLVGNLCVLKAILGGDKRHRKSRVNFMLMHLAIADLIVTMIMIPEEMAWAATVQWKAGDFLCRFFSFFRIFGHYLSSFILVCISMDRYFAIVHPLSSSVSSRRGKYMIGTAWVLATTCAAPQMAIFHVASHPIHTHYTQCVTFGSFPSRQYEIAYNLFCLTMLYLAPLLIIILSYGVMVVTIARKAQSASDETTIRRSGTGFLSKAKARTIQMTVSIVAAFFVCWTPYVVISLWFCIDPAAGARIDQRIQKALFIFACTNSCANPIVYGIFNFCQKQKPKAAMTWRSNYSKNSRLQHTSAIRRKLSNEQKTNNQFVLNGTEKINYSTRESNRSHQNRGTMKVLVNARSQDYMDGSKYLVGAKYLDGTKYSDEAKYLGDTDYLGRAEYVDDTKYLGSAEFVDDTKYLDDINYVDGSKYLGEAKCVDGTYHLDDSKKGDVTDYLDSADYLGRRKLSDGAQMVSADDTNIGSDSFNLLHDKDSAIKFDALMI